MLNFFKKKKSPPKRSMTLAEYIQWRQSQGDTLEKIQKDLHDDLENGGPLFGEFRKFIKPTSPNSTQRFDDEYAEALSKSSFSDLWVWENCKLKNQKKYPICQDCLSRHGQAKTKKEWEVIGLPKSGHTQCGKKCVCILTPKELFDYKVKKGINVEAPCPKS